MNDEPMDFDTAWEHLDKLGFPVIHLSDDEYKQLVGDIDKASDMNEVDDILGKLRSSD